ncbi:hypothetical protein [uncultured Dokdonia sp.]|uniref:hypothetical protein n=1 Tax=uncultured Dokdonia sp. TaxID=575653 RepID=UPI0026368772|nr:hypothetical protein [uncultured Dokdonia sp.]
MILKDFYLDKKARIEAETGFSGVIPDITLYNDTIFRTPITTPTVLFKYDTVDWETSSEQTYKADATFCIYIVLPLQGQLASIQNYEIVFDIAQNIDKAILSRNTTATPLIDSNSTFKIKEKQYCNHEQDNWEKTDYFIWEISYKTTLIETELKKRYRLVYNGATVEELENQGYTLTEGPAGAFISLEDQEINEIIESPLKNNN